jgi:predicted nuclease of predicted toxin-antitoxin system
MKKRKIVSGLLRRNPFVDVVRVLDTGLMEAEDRTLLEWAAHYDRVLLTHDVRTLVGFAWEFVRLGKPMAGMIVLGNVRVSQAVEKLLLIADCSEPEGVGRRGSLTCPYSLFRPAPTLQ